MNRLKFSIKPNLKIKEFKNLIVKFKKIKIIKLIILNGIIFQIPFGKSKFFIAKYEV